MTVAAPTKFAHIVYRTRRFEEMLDWYAKVFDAKIQFKNPAIAFLTYDDEHHRFAIVNMSVLHPDGTETEKHDSIGVDHVGYTLSSLGDLMNNYSNLSEHGIKPYWCVHHGITVSMYYADPDGNQMEFQVDLLGSSDERSKFMSVGFEANPVGVEFEPEAMLADYRAGRPENELLSFYREGAPVSPIRGAFARLVGV